MEQNLWRQGILSWEAFLAQCDPTHPTSPRSQDWPQLVEESLRQFDQNNPAYFSDRLPANQAWRLFQDFRHACAYLDIETTGLGSPSDHVTTIALFNGECLRCYVHGINLDEFPRDVQDYKLLVTFNGATFDLPFLERHFQLPLKQAHIDLRYVLRSLGFSGGLKRCERAMGLARPGLEDVDGFAAVLLWHEYRKTRNPRALETLLAYNVQDTINLQTLMIEAYQRRLEETPFAAQYRLENAPTVENPYTPDPALVKKVTQEGGWRIPFRR
jgi:uncharacterized protein YprB with RNaseH-like and TPR domain